MGDWDKAAADFTTVIEKDPNDAQAYERRGFVYRSQKKFNEAIADYDKSLEIKPDPDVYTKRGVHLRHLPAKLRERDSRLSAGPEN